MVFAVISTYVIASLSLSFSWVLIVLLLCASHYSLSVIRMRRRMVDDVRREVTGGRLGDMTETADWLNGFFDRYWLMCVLGCMLNRLIN